MWISSICNWSIIKQYSQSNRLLYFKCIIDENSVNKVALTETIATLEGYATVFAKNGYLFYFSTHGCQPK